MDNSELSFQSDPTKRIEGVEQPLGKLPTEVQSPSVTQAINTLKLIRAKAKADTANCQQQLVMQQFRPCKIYPVIIYHDGMRWVCSHGVLGEAYQEYLPNNAMGQAGAEAYGEFPEQAMQNFDAMWLGTVSENIATADEDEDEDEDYEDEL